MSCTHRVLIVDDEQSSRRAVARYLAARGCPADEAGSAAEAEHLPATNLYGAMLCGLNLGGGEPDGFSAWSTFSTSPQALAALAEVVCRRVSASGGRSRLSFRAGGAGRNAAAPYERIVAPHDSSLVAREGGRSSPHHCALHRVNRPTRKP